ncbi:MAG: glycosyltransferase family 2 protein [Methylobacter sp.]|uniref:glycosyltransferase family 2 protein n=1 Tax=Methylobacter sp. TaxID=2051955 RepID=UPI002730F02D|nr:glycosyltransferase family 2 protein [Methylobacter sp.]MDP1664053.1 glycosyltransferase family 2 protein [Methylobacter sp.]
MHTVSNALPTVCVVIPTYNHVHTLLRSIKSVQQQHFQNFKLIVIGDGAPVETDRLMSVLCAEDSRIEFRPHPKGAGHGEAYRAAVISELDCAFICYLGDDDLWLPHHLDVMVKLLESNDFVHTLHTSVHTDGTIHSLGGRIDDAATREIMARNKWNIFGPTCVGHTLQAYHRLPYGWRPRPDGIWSDLYMWRQWIDMPDCHFYSHPLPTTLHFPSPLRLDISLEVRCAELDLWLEKITDPTFSQYLVETVMGDWQTQLTPAVPITPQNQEDRNQINRLEALIGSYDEQFEALAHSYDERLEVLMHSHSERLEALVHSHSESLETLVHSYDEHLEVLVHSHSKRLEALVHSYDECLATLAQSNVSLKNSRSWRITYPLRAIRRFIYRR